jgi:putative membrane protein
MILEALLAYAHFAAILTVVVFMTSEAALCRPQWFNAEVVRRLGRVDAIYWGGLVAVLATGVARMAWGVKGLSWYAAQPLLHLKIALFVVIALISLRPTRAFARWRRTLAATGRLPEPAELNAARRWVMIASHLLVLLPLAAVFVARGVGTT